MSIWRSIRYEFSLLVVACAFSVPLWAQLPTATLNGFVSDPQGAVVAGARVVITFRATAITPEETTGSAGQYVFADLEAGDYAIRVEAIRFAVREFKTVRLEVGRTKT